MMKWWNERARGRGAETIEHTPTLRLHMSRLEARVETLEGELQMARRDLAKLDVELAATVQRSNNYVDLVEQRIDLIHRQVILELKRAFDLGVATVEIDSAIDERLAEIFSAGLRAKVDLGALAMKAILSDRLEPGPLPSPLTFCGFRIDRARARELGDGIEMFPVGEATPGTAVYGPYKRLAPGFYRIEAHLRREGSSPTTAPEGDIALDVYSPGVDKVLADTSLPASALASASAQSISVPFEWTTQAAADKIEIRVHQRSTTRVLITKFTLHRMGN